MDRGLACGIHFRFSLKSCTVRNNVLGSQDECTRFAEPPPRISKSCDDSDEPPPSAPAFSFLHNSEEWPPKVVDSIEVETAQFVPFTTDLPFRLSCHVRQKRMSGGRSTNDGDRLDAVRCVAEEDDGHEPDETIISHECSLAV